MMMMPLPPPARRENHHLVLSTLDVKWRCCRIRAPHDNARPEKRVACTDIVSRCISIQVSEHAAEKEEEQPSKCGGVHSGGLDFDHSNATFSSFNEFWVSHRAQTARGSTAACNNRAPRLTSPRRSRTSIRRAAATSSRRTSFHLVACCEVDDDVAVRGW